MTSTTSAAPGLRSVTAIAPAVGDSGSAPKPKSARNPGVAFDAGWIRGLQANRSAIERRTASLTKRRSVKKTWQAAWLLRAITCIDLTTLAGDDTPGRVRRLCAKALRPVRADLLAALGMADAGITAGAVCVYHAMVPTAVEALAGSGVPVAAVSTGFPDGQIGHDLKLREIEASVAAGAAEIDIVISRAHVLTGDWPALHREIQEFRSACGEAHMKTILATGQLGTLQNVAKASMVAMMAGADFIKTSTGKEAVNATLPVSLVMLRAIRDYRRRVGVEIGFKPAGGIRTAAEALQYQVLMKEELGVAWLGPRLFRFGASGLLADIERQLEHHLSGHYSSFDRHPVG